MNGLVWELIGLAFFLLVLVVLWKKVLWRIPSLNQVVDGKVQLVGMGILFPAAMLWMMFPLGTNIWQALAIVALTLSGLADDLWDTPIILRLLIQFCAAISLVTLDIDLPLWLLILLAVAWMNMFNFMDGSNGMMGLTALSTTLVLAGFSLIIFGYKYYTFQIPVFELIIALAFSLIVFGWGNFRNKAIWISGDTGSVVLGYGFFWVFLSLFQNPESKTILLILLCLFSVFITETGCTLLFRLWRRENIFKRHQQHIYQRLIYQKGFKHMHIAIIYAALQLISSCYLFWQMGAGKSQALCTLHIFAVLTASWLFLNYRLPNTDFSE
jgi:UDP-GlcNAc:undecaprenyl-phosphate GlcNAc-1-phosphate transferase